MSLDEVPETSIIKSVYAWLIELNVTDETEELTVTLSSATYVLVAIVSPLLYAIQGELAVLCNCLTTYGLKREAGNC